MNLLQMSFSGAIMILVIILIRSIMIYRLPKKTFLVLWGVVLLRLLIPFSIPSMFSAYTMVEQKPYIDKQINGQQVTNKLPVSTLKHIESIETSTRYVDTKENPISIIFLIWIIGVIFCLTIFAYSYWRCMREFRLSLPVECMEAEQWLQSHNIRRKIEIHDSDCITTPLTYGIFHPVILLPKDIDWKNDKEIQYVLSHEYVHIKGYDIVKKLILILASCIHWFNPLIWIMYNLANRDMELSCDEEVLKAYGESGRAEYARMLICLEEKKTGMDTFCNGFSKNGIEERIIAIMKNRKKTVFTIAVAVIIVFLVSIIFATSAKEHPLKEDLTIISGNEFTQIESEKIFSLWIDGYENMTVSDYQQKMWLQYDNLEDIALIDRFSKSEGTYELEDSKENQAFMAFYDYFFSVYEPLTAEKWNNREFSGFTTTNIEKLLDNATLEYTISLEILDANTLLVKEYEMAKKEILNELQHFLENKTMEELANQKKMEQKIQEKINSMTAKWNSDKLKIKVIFRYIPVSIDLDSQQSANSGQRLGEENPAEGFSKEQIPEEGKEDVKPRKNSYGTAEDYRSLFVLMTPDYQQKILLDFNQKLLDWGNEDFERMERISEDVGRNDYHISLSDEERYFLSNTFKLSNTENTQRVKSIINNKVEEDPWAGEMDLQKTDEKNHAAAWCQLYYQFSYHITDMTKVTVGERDKCIGGMISSVQDFWNQMSIDDLLSMTQKDMVQQLKVFAEKNSNAQVKISINEKQIGFEGMDEREKE